MYHFFEMTKLGSFGEPPTWLDFAIQHRLVDVILAYSREWKLTDVEQTQAKELWKN